MLVNFKRDFFGPGGVLYTKGTREYNADENLLPRDAVVVSKQGHLPVQENTPKAGHGAKPIEEQILDMIPSAGKTHQIEPADGGHAPALTDDQKAERQKENDDAARKADEARAEEAKKADADLAKSVEKALPLAQKAADAVAKANDPLDILKDDKAKK